MALGSGASSNRVSSGQVIPTSQVESGYPGGAGCSIVVNGVRGAVGGGVGDAVADAVW